MVSWFHYQWLTRDIGESAGYSESISESIKAKENWVPGWVDKIHIDGVPLSPFYGVHQDLPIEYTNTQVKVYDYSDKYLLLSPRKLKVVPYAKRS